MRRRFSKGVLSVVFLALAAWVCACGQSVEQGHGDGGVEIKVTYGTTSQTVKLTDITPSTVEGVSGALLTDVITRAFPSITLADIGADFIAADGFRPSKKNACRILIPLQQATLEKGVLDPVSGNLLWAPSLGFGGCLQPKGVVEVYVVNLADNGPTFQVKLAANTVDIDLRFQPTADFGGEQRIPLQTLVTASGATDSPQIMSFDFQDAAGHSPGTDGGETLLTWDQVAALSLGIAARDLTADAGAGLPAAWSMSEAKAVILHETAQAPKKVKVVLGASEVEIDLGALSTVDVGGSQLVVLQTVVTAAALVADPSTQHFDLEASDGFRPTIDRTTDPLSWEQLGKAYLNLYSRNASFDASLGLASYWSVKSVVKVHLLPK